MLRDYQVKIYSDVLRSLKQGHKRVLVTSPCGSGKSYIFLEMVRNASAFGNVLVLVHRIELKEQHIKLFKENNINMNHVRVELIMTEANHLGEHKTPYLIIADEAHLSMSISWNKVFDYYNSYTVGFTATPARLDGKSLGNLYDSLVTGPEVKELIEKNCLSPYDYYAPLSVDVAELSVKYGDFSTTDLEPLLMNSAIYSNVIKSYKKLANGKKAIAYCISVKHSKEVCSMFNKAGIKAAHIDGTTPVEERLQIMEDFKNNKITILCNCMLIIEGVSIDDCECCLLLRPTASLVLYIQSAMRCMRYKPGKKAIIIDCVGNYARHGLPDDERKWELTNEVKSRKMFNDEGDLFVRQCPYCFKVFKTASTCPYCKKEYPLTDREIKKHEEIELKKITEEENKKIQQEKKHKRIEVGMARTRLDLEKIAKDRGYKPGWVWRMCKVKNIKY